MGRLKDGAKIGGAGLGFYVGGVIVVLIIAATGVYVFGGFSQLTAPFRGETEKRELVEGSGAFRIAAYDHFFDLCTTIQGQEATIISLQQELASGPSKARREQIQATLTTLRAQRVTNIAQYNNDGAKDYTAGQFRDSDLPYPLNPNQEQTTCTY